MMVGGQCHLETALGPGEKLYPFYRRLRGPQGQSGRVCKISPSPVFDPQTVQPVASSYTDFAIPVRSEPVEEIVFQKHVVFACVTVLDVSVRFEVITQFYNKYLQL